MHAARRDDRLLGRAAPLDGAEHDDRTRFSIDFRTVNLDDLVEGVGAPNIDSECTGTTLRDFLRASDLEPLPEEVIAAYDRPRVAATTAG